MKEKIITGTSIEICDGQPATHDQAGFEALFAERERAAKREAEQVVAKEMSIACKVSGRPHQSKRPRGRRAWTEFGR